jgi:Zn-dependent protease
MLGQMPRWKLFELRGNKVFLEPLFLLLVAFFVFSGLTSASQLGAKLLWVPILFIGVLWHEFGHAFAIQHFGYGPSKIVLQGLGGVTINERRGGSPPGKSIVISFAGPLFSFSLTLIFGLAAYFYPGQDLLNQFFYLMALVNGFWGVFNLLPIAPLDGGHIVLHALRAKFPRRKALLYSAYSSLAVLALSAIPLLMFVDPLFTILLALIFAAHNWRILQALKR